MRDSGLLLARRDPATEVRILPGLLVPLISNSSCLSVMAFSVTLGIQRSIDHRVDHSLSRMGPRNMVQLEGVEQSQVRLHSARILSHPRILPIIDSLHLLDHELAVCEDPDIAAAPLAHLLDRQEDRLVLCLVVGVSADAPR